MTMGDRIAVLEDSYLRQVDSPRNLNLPANMFCCRFHRKPAQFLRRYAGR